MQFQNNGPFFLPVLGNDKQEQHDDEMIELLTTSTIVPMLLNIIPKFLTRVNKYISEDNSLTS